MMEVDALTSLLMFWMFLYFALLVIPLTFKFFGLDVVADPLIRLVNRVMLLPFWLAKRALTSGQRCPEWHAGWWAGEGWGRYGKPRDRTAGARCAQEREIRDALQRLVLADLHGPLGGDDEEFSESERRADP
jgi:hypothetical protein